MNSETLASSADEKATIALTKIEMHMETCDRKWSVVIRLMIALLVGMATVIAAQLNLV